MKKVGVVRLHILAAWRTESLFQFFAVIGFKRGDMINLEFKIDD